MLPPCIGYIKELSPHLPIPHAEQARGHWVGAELDAISRKIDLKILDSLSPPVGLVHLHDYLTAGLALVQELDTTRVPIFLCTGETGLHDRPDTAGHLLFDLLGVPAANMVAGASHAVMDWGDLVAMAGRAWQEGRFVTRETYEKEGPCCLRVLDGEWLEQDMKSPSV